MSGCLTLKTWSLDLLMTIRWYIAKSKESFLLHLRLGAFTHCSIIMSKCSLISRSENLTSDGEFRYLTSPSGNPNNFSFVVASLGERAYEIRQQLKIYSELDEYISFAPDLSVVKMNTHIEKVKDEDYAKGKRSFYRVSSKDVIAAHECKSLPPFPELMVSFIGMFVTAHSWHTDQTCGVTKDDTGLHLAPTLFVGGSAQAMHLKMIAAIQKVHPLNIVVGMHQGNWDLYGPHKKLNRLDVVGDREALTLAKPLSDFLTPVGLE